MELEITPEPPPGEREAVAKALAQLLAPRRDLRGEWWRAGVRENVLGETRVQAGWRPLSKRGTTRA